MFEVPGLVGKMRAEVVRKIRHVITTLMYIDLWNGLTAHHRAVLILLVPISATSSVSRVIGKRCTSALHQRFVTCSKTIPFSI